MQDLASWLKRCQLEQYLEAFTSQDITVELLPDLDTDDLRELGMTLGDRKRFLRAIADSQTDSTKKSLTDSEAERRQLTVMFVDLVGSTALAESLDPEDMSELVRHFQTGVQRCVERYRGYVSRYMGDGVLIYFGWPTASEDDASRAIRTALEITRETMLLKAPDGRSLACRSGIATGLVVVGEMIGIGTSQEHAVVGETPNLAARLQSLADENAIVVSDSTRRLAGNHFHLQALGLHHLKGIRDPVPAFQVLETREVESRYIARQGGQTMPMVGRQKQIDALQHNWRAAQRGGQQAVLLQGEAGIGKSRLLYAFFDSLVGNRYGQCILQCDPVRSDSALYPAIALISRLAGIQSTTAESTRAEKIRTLCESVPDVAILSAKAAVYPLIASLVSVDADAVRAQLTHLNARQQKALTLAAICGVLSQAIRTESGKPALFVLEDAHWADSTTVELLRSILQGADGGGGALLVITARPEFQASQLAIEPLEVIELARLANEECQRLIASVAGQRFLSDSVLEQLVQRTDGIPLYAEELTKAIIEAERSDDGDASTAASPDIPESLYDSLMARLDRLPSVREVAQTAACLGREFQVDQLREIMQLDAAFLDGALRSLTDAEVVFQRDAHTFVFKHALLRDAAYESLLRSKRQQIHRRTASVLQQHYTTVTESQPELIAYHLQQAAQLDEASRYWLRASTLALQRVANPEAVAHATAGLRCLDSVQPADEVSHTAPSQRRYELLFARGMGFMATRGYAADTVQDNFSQALELADALGDAERYSQAARGVVTAHIVSSRFAEGLQLADAMLARAETPMQNFFAHRMQGQIYFWQARFIESRRAFEHAIALYDGSHQSPLSQWDDGVLSTGFLGITMTCLGHTDAGEQLHRQSLEMAENLNQPFSVCQAMESWITSILLRDDDFSALLERFAQMADQHQMVFFQACARLYQGIATIRSGAPERGVEIASEGLELYRACQSMLGVPKWITYVAEGYLQVGDTGRATALLDEAWQAMDEWHNDYFRGEWMRIKAATLMCQGHAEEAQQRYRQSIDLARKQQASLFELTSTLELAQSLPRASGQDTLAQLRTACDAFENNTAFGHLQRARSMLASS